MILFRLLGVLALASAATADITLARRGPTRPNDDSFYHPKGDWKSKEPGTILDSRQIDPAVATFFDMGVYGHQLLYRTNGVNEDTPMATVVSVLVPEKYDHDKIVTVNAYQDSFSDKCAPSYTLQKGAQLFKNLAFTYQQLFMLTLLNEGWVVVIPDHEGPDSAFASGFVEGHAVLDAVRATLKFDKVNLKKNAKVIGYGYSGGALATGWAAALHSSYAPDLNVVGWALGGTVANVKEWFKYIDGSAGAGFVMAGIGGIVESYKELGWIKDMRTSAGKKAWKDSQGLCMLENLWHFSDEKILSSKYFKYGDTYLDNDDVTSVLDTLTLGSDNNLTPSAPMYMFHASHDEVVPYWMALDAAQNWCRNGAKIHFVTNTGGEMVHQNTELYNHPDVIKFMRRRFGGKSFASECKFDTVHNPWFNPFTLGKSAAQFVQQVLDLLTGSFSAKDEVYHYDKKTSA